MTHSDWSNFVTHTACESHFKECRNRQARKLNEHVDEIVKTCDALLEAVSPVAYERARENLLKFV